MSERREKGQHVDPGDGAGATEWDILEDEATEQVVAELAHRNDSVTGRRHWGPWRPSGPPWLARALYINGAGVTLSTLAAACSAGFSILFATDNETRNLAIGTLVASGTALTSGGAFELWAARRWRLEPTSLPAQALVQVAWRAYEHLVLLVRARAECTWVLPYARTLLITIEGIVDQIDERVAAVATLRKIVPTPLATISQIDEQSALLLVEAARHVATLRVAGYYVLRIRPGHRSATAPGHKRAPLHDPRTALRALSA